MQKRLTRRNGEETDINAYAFVFSADGTFAFYGGGAVKLYIQVEDEEEFFRTTSTGVFFLEPVSM